MIGTWGSFGTMGMNLELVTGVIDCLELEQKFNKIEQLIKMIYRNVILFDSLMRHKYFIEKTHNL